MTSEAEMDNLVCKALTIQDDYTKFSPQPRNQDITCHTGIIEIFHDLPSTIETLGPHQDKAILQETLVELYSVLGIPQEPVLTTSTKFNEPGQSTEIAPISLGNNQANNQQSKGFKRNMLKDEQNETKKSKIQTDDSLEKNNRSRKRTIYSKEQTLFLQNQFDLNPYPDFVNRCRISKQTGIPEPRIQVWFQNRRARHLSKTTKRGGPHLQEDPCVPLKEMWSGANIL